MTEETPPVTTALDPDDFDKPASRGFVRYELVTTRSELREEIAATKLELKQDIANVRTELKQDIANVRTELKQDIANVRLELKQDIANVRLEIAELRTEMIDRFNKLDRSLWWKLSVAVAAASALSELLSRM